MFSDNRFRSRKFILALSSFLVVSFMAGFAVVAASLAKEFSEVALIMAAWGASDAGILKLYNDANIQDEGGKE